MAEPRVGSQKEYGKMAVIDQLRIKLSRAVRSGLPGLWGTGDIVTQVTKSLTFKFVVLGRKWSEV